MKIAGDELENEWREGVQATDEKLQFMTMKRLNITPRAFVPFMFSGFSFVILLGAATILNNLIYSLLCLAVISTSAMYYSSWSGLKRSKVYGAVFHVIEHGMICVGYNRTYNRGYLFHLSKIWFTQNKQSRMIVMHYREEQHRLPMQTENQHQAVWQWLSGHGYDQKLDQREGNEVTVERVSSSRRMGLAYVVFHYALSMINILGLFAILQFGFNGDLGTGSFLPFLLVFAILLIPFVIYGFCEITAHRFRMSVIFLYDDQILFRGIGFNEVCSYDNVMDVKYSHIFGALKIYILGRKKPIVLLCVDPQDSEELINRIEAGKQTQTNAT